MRFVVAELTELLILEIRIEVGVRMASHPSIRA
jgi:hypothetical protein